MLAPPGLDGVVVADTAVGAVDGEAGTFQYRGRDAVALARTSSFEEVVALLLDAPVALGPARTVDPPVEASSLRSAVSLFGERLALRPVVDLTTEEVRADCVRLVAAMPSLVTGGRADPSLSHAADVLRMLTGSTDPARARLLEQYLVLAADHGMNASTFTARVITSTGADVAAAVVGAIGALSGPRHGGAPSRALDLLDAVGEPDRARAVVESVVDSGGRVMGFGNRLYRSGDPRAALLRELALGAGARLAPLALEVEAVVAEVLASRRPDRPLPVNMEFWAGVVLDHCGIDRARFTATFACARVAGWCAHVLEQAGSGNRMYRPTARYVPPEVR